MEKIKIIIYSIDGNDQSIKDSIKLLGDWFNPFQGVWLINTMSSVKEIYNRIGTNKSDDKFLVLEVDLQNYWGILSPEAWKWLQDKTYNQYKDYDVEYYKNIEKSIINSLQKPFTGCQISLKKGAKYQVLQNGSDLIKEYKETEINYFSHLNHLK